MSLLEEKPAIRNVWAREIAVEESAYLHRGGPVLLRQAQPSTVGRPRLLDLFCGAGGASFGFAAAGFEVVAGIDIHRPSMATYTANHPNAGALLGDIREATPELLAEAAGTDSVEALVAGAPCQGFSRSNRKRWDADPRNYLFREFIRLLGHFRPPLVLFENVSGLASSANGTFAEKIRRAIQRCGYRVDVARLNAADYGVPQIRQRLFFLGIQGRGPFPWPQPAFGSRAGRPHLTVRDAIGDLPPLNPGATASSYLCEPSRAYQWDMRVGSECLHNHQAPAHPLEVQRKIGQTPPGQPIYPRFRQRIRLDWRQPSPTQVAGGIRPQYQFGHPRDARGLTIRERCRLQSFPDRFQVEGGLVQGRVQTGNAVPPRLAQAIATAIAARL